LLPERIGYLVKPQRGGPERTIAEFDLPTAFVRSRAGVFFLPKCAWTPESKSLIVVGRNSQQELPALFLVSLENDEKRRLTDPPSRFADTDPAISPDGRALAFSRIDQNGRCDLLRLGLSENLTPQGRPERLTSDNPINRNPVWTADGLEIAFVSGATGDQSLWKLTASRSAGRARLAFAGELVDSPAISRHGKRLAYEIQKGDQDIWRVEVPGQGTEPKGAVKLIASTRAETDPTFSPDGKKVAFSSTRSGSPEIWACDNDGSHPVQLTWFGGPATNRPRWSPDGQLIVFYSDARGKP
jgi:Tol biopolymer transport system component